MNKQKWSLILLLLCMLYPRDSYAYKERNLLQKEVSLESLKSMLILNKQWVKYPSYTDRKGWDELLGEYKEEIMRNGEALLNYKWQVVKATDYLEFERTGNRVVMENPFNDNNQAITRLLLAELAEGKGRFVDQLINGVFHSCEMTSWALSAHLIVQPSRRSLPSYDYPVLDLTAGDLGNLLSWTYYFMHDTFERVNPEIPRRLYKELNERIMQPYMENDKFWWMAVDYKGQMLNNWNPWCNSNALMTFMLLEENPDKLAKAIYRSIQSVDKFLNYVHADGACEEGPSYWGHAPGKVLDYLVLLSDITGGKVNIFSNPQIRNMGEYISRSHVGNSWVVNFADASAKGGGDAHLIYRYGKSVGSEELKCFAADLLGNKKRLSLGGRDVYRILEALSINEELKTIVPKHQTPSFTWYPETEFCYIKKNKAFLATKGGYNAESHNHNDAGSFSLWVEHTPILIDAGVGTYNRQTFSSERYSIWTMQSDYHNLPIINGSSQKYGKKYRATEVKANEEGFSVNLATAYPQEAKVEKWIRSYRLKANRLTIEDRFALTESIAPNQINFLTWGEVDVEEGKVTIRVADTKAILKFDSKLFTVVKETVPLTDTRLSNVWGKQIYRIALTAKQKTIKGNYTFNIDF